MLQQVVCPSWPTWEMPFTASTSLKFLSVLSLRAWDRPAYFQKSR